MSTPRKHGRTDGCWTCKLRRKKCDELRPTCGNCDNLDITCDYGPKPRWMDSGEKQRQKTELLKSEIKRNAAYRREKANTGEVHQFDVISDIMASNDISSSEPISTPGSVSIAPALHEHTPFPLQPHGHQQHRCSNCREQSSAIDIDFIMKYLDFVFPALFPFYSCGFFSTGRSWLLLLLGKSKIAYHSTVSLSIYYFTLALAEADRDGESEDCKELRWTEAVQQTNQCYDSIRTDMLALDLNLEGTLEKVEILESIIQVLIFEMALGKSAPWNSHLPPAFALFEDIIAFSGRPTLNRGQTKLAAVLLNIGQPSWANADRSSHIWSPDQAGFQFCAGLLIFIDVVASTAIQEAPRLLRYHPDVLARIDEGTSVLRDAEVRLSSIVGCRNWVIRSIGEISTLDSWKREQTEYNCLSVVELVDRAFGIANDLRNGIVEIRNRHATNIPSYMSHRAPFDIPSASTSSVPTLIWAHAAQLYLTVVVSGWQLSNTEIREHVAQIIKLLQIVPPHQLRALAWPLCVAGCLALESEESSFVALLSNQAKVYTAGALDDAQQILEQVWHVRTTLYASTWNLASCFSILGSPVLLV